MSKFAEVMGDLVDIGIILVVITAPFWLTAIGLFLLVFAVRLAWTLGGAL